MWLRNLRVVLADRLINGSIRIEDGLIADVREGGSEGLDMGGLLAMPGLVDLHGDMLEREVEPRPNAQFPLECAIAENDKRLASNGITTAYAAIAFSWEDFGDLRSEERAREMIDVILGLTPSLLVDHRIHVRFAITNPEGGPILEDLIRQGKIHLISLMDHTPGQGQFRDIERYINFAIEWRKITVGKSFTEEEMREHIAEMQARPKAWDLVRDIADLAREADVPLSSHDDDSPEKVAFLAELGASMSEFPIDLASAQAAKDLGVHVIMGAPNAFRGVSSTVGNLSALDGVRAGVVDILASDYYPAAMLQAPFRVFREGALDLAEAAALVTANPAKAAGLHDRGRIEAGLRADLVLVDDAAYPRVRATLRAGRPVYRDASCPDIEVLARKQPPQMAELTES